MNEVDNIIEHEFKYKDLLNPDFYKNYKYSNNRQRVKENWNDCKLRINNFIDKHTDRSLSDSDDYLMEAKELYFLEQILKDLLKLFKFDEKKILLSEMDINHNLSKNELMKKLSEELEKNQNLSSDIKEKIEQSLDKKSDLFQNAINEKLKEFEKMDKDELGKYVSGEKEIFTASDFLQKDITKIGDKFNTLMDDIKDKATEVKDGLVDDIKDKATNIAKNVIKMR
ncbi:hypothetical protein [Campylobacter lanienae]|uniref:hypothetical protein n=1 Tax=Campylobacter lanienae TaxID=75658 RepID=UPI000BB40E71|nr:hypothetical protein [Campylobacter lanienae]